MFRKIITLLLCLWGIMDFGLSARADDLQDISKSIASTAELVSKGSALYMSNCMTCHGATGMGDGPAAAAFNPKPRNFLAEKYKQGASPSSVFFTVTNGMGSMPAFASMSVADRLAVIHYVLSLSPNKESDTPESLAKIGLDPSGKPLADFKGKAEELPIEFIIERMATDGDINLLNYAEISKKLADHQAKEAARSAPVVIKPDLKRGEALYKSCVVCHGANGEGSELAKAPQIAGQDTDYLISQLKKFQDGIRGANINDANGLRMRPMSRLLQNEAEVIHVSNFIHQLTPKKLEPTLSGGDPEKGKMAYGTCASCHGADAKGVKAMSAPSLLDLPDWYIFEQIHKFKSGYRGGDPKDATGATMKGMSMMIADDQALKDIISYIGSLKK